MRSIVPSLVASALLMLFGGATVSANQQQGTGTLGPAVPVRFVFKGRIVFHDDNRSGSSNWSKGTITTIYSGSGTGWYSYAAGVIFVMSAALTPPHTIPSRSVHVTNIINVRGAWPKPFNCHLAIRSAIPLQMRDLRLLGQNGAFLSSQPPIPPSFGPAMFAARFHFITPAGCRPLGGNVTQLSLAPNKTESWIGPSAVDCTPNHAFPQPMCFPKPGETLHVGATYNGTTPGSISGFFSLNITFLNRNLGSQAGLPRYPPGR